MPFLEGACALLAKGLVLPDEIVMRFLAVRPGRYGAAAEVLSAVAERYWSTGGMEKGRILDALCRTTAGVKVVETEAPRERQRRYGARIKNALTALWEAPDRVCGKRLVAMIPTLVPTAGCSSAKASGRNCSR
jgi:hypothetical protein